MADEDFDREMRDVDWAEVYERQAARGDLTPTIVELLDLGTGGAVLDLGCGPGYTAIQLARRGACATVYALDARRAALRFLREQAGPAGDRIQPVVGDITALPIAPASPLPTLAAFVLHHIDRPDRAVASIGDVLPTGTPLLVIEYDPDAEGEFGPPTDHRLSTADCTGWLQTAGFTVETTVTLPEEKYGILARRA